MVVFRSVRIVMNYHRSRFSIFYLKYNVIHLSSNGDLLASCVVFSLGSNSCLLPLTSCLRPNNKSTSGFSPTRPDPSLELSVTPEKPPDLRKIKINTRLAIEKVNIIFVILRKENLILTFQVSGSHIFNWAALKVKGLLAINSHFPYGNFARKFAVGFPCVRFAFPQ